MNVVDCSSLSNRILGDIAEAQALARPNDIWLVDEREKLTFAQAHALSNAVANKLLELGVGKGELVVASLRPSVKSTLIGLGAMKIGAIFVPTSTERHHAGIAEIKAKKEPAMLIVEADLLPDVEGLGLGHDAVVLVDGGDGGTLSVDELFTGRTSRPDAVVDPLDVVLLLRTSGTTGSPKWVACSQSFLAHMSWRGILKNMRDGDVTYSCTVNNHMAYWTFAILSSLIGGTAVAIDAQFSASQYWERVRYYGASRLLLLGAMHQYVWDVPPTDHDAENRAWFACFSPIRAEMIPKFKARYGLEKMGISYGCSESGMVSEGFDMDWEGADTDLGDVVEGYELKLMDEDGHEVTEGVPGEICVRALQPGIMFSGYYGDEEATAASFRDGWYLTGDMGVKEGGRLHFNGRKKDCVRHNGRNISLFEVEQFASEAPGVREVAALGIPCADAVSEDEVVLAAVLEEGARSTSDDIARYVYEHAPYYLVPDYIMLVEELPRNKSGRVVKHELEKSFDKGSAWKKERAKYGRK